MKIDFIKIRSLIQKKKETKLYRVLRRMIILGIILFVVYTLIPLSQPLFEQEYTTVIVDENNEILRAFLNRDQQWYFPPQNEIPVPEKLKKAIICFEDRFFYYHPGFNPVSMIRALYQNISSLKIKSGASTISMQVIRIATKNSRTLFNKFLELLQAIKLEIRFSKKQILKMYLDHAPFGGNIIGFNAACQKYFGKKPGQLTWSQAAILAVLPNSPGLISPLFNQKELFDKKNRLLKKLLKRGIIDSEIFRISSRESIPLTFKSFFRSAPHLAQTLINKYPVRSRYIKTNIVIAIQRRVETLLKEHMKYLHSLGIFNGAAVVVETGTGKVRAYVGSHDFFDGTNQGQVDGIMSARSSGSILKPFLYALAMDEGLILPQTMIKDIPSYFGPFSPANADRQFSGIVTAQEALTRSLNVPAVRLLNNYGHNRFYLFLKSAGLSTLFRDPDDYGLTLILGGAETSLYDLAQLYAGLGNYGLFRPLKLFYSQEPETKRGLQLISPEASLLTLEILNEVKRPGSEFYWEQYQHQNPLAWKTGTSYGQRDAWAVGVNPSWTIAVWTGNFNGEGNSNLSGAKCSAPLLFDIFNYLPKLLEKYWFDKHNTRFKKISVCLDTGFAAGPACDRTILVDSPATITPLKKCGFHKKIYLTLDEKERVCSLCWQQGKYKTKNILVFPPDVSQYLWQRGIVLATLPPHSARCSAVDEHNPIQIIYPVPNAKIWIPTDFHNVLQKITFTVAHRLKGRKIYWYINNVYQGFTRKKHKMALQLKQGWHQLEVVDSKGFRDSRKFHIVSGPNQGR